MRPPKSPNALKAGLVRTASATDQLVGKRLRECRLALGMSAHEFSELIGVTYQQVNKYERAINRISAGRLYEIARELGVSIEYFFEGLERDEEQLPHGQRRLLEIMRNLAEIKSEKHLDAISQLIRSLRG